MSIDFPSPPAPDYAGGCTTEPASFALDFYAERWRADVRVGDRVLENVVVFQVLKDLKAALEAGQAAVSRADYEAARERFLQTAGAQLEREGGRREWLAREL
ncbi:hypothetical protein HNR42_000255 [Deinobacterium chartae]|uniref:Uncharacterized protein n=1 Tax=Deinobacterium chartae TaxID=521158 RepID=A0A841HVI7_9DEIO|nr:hypothetical protein [Deinobacterium chartae]MBB6096843.1 hypothetical protein [Deinobacterium chartae]